MDVTEMIEHAGIRPTPVRLLVARAIDVAGCPVSSLDLERTLETVDRSSISRTLVLFSAKGLVHSVDDGSGAVKYELCHHCGEDHDSDLHPHFHCLSCGRTYCIDELSIPPVTLPEGFEARSANFVIKGLYPGCRAK